MQQIGLISIVSAGVSELFGKPQKLLGNPEAFELRFP